jgi:hypothetical protein
VTESSENKPSPSSIDLPFFQDWVMRITLLQRTATRFVFELEKLTRPLTPRASRHGQRAVRLVHSFEASISRKAKTEAFSSDIQLSERIFPQEQMSDSWPCGAALLNQSLVHALRAKPS